MHARKTQRTPFEVVELGMGKRPVGLVKKASQRINSRRKTNFLGVDIREVNLDAVLKEAKLKRTPKNLSFLVKCAVSALEEMPPNSKHIIFASFLANNLAWQTHKLNKKIVRKDLALIIAAKRVLVPGGRLILVDALGTKHIYAKDAKKAGLSLHVSVISDEVAKNSPAAAIRDRSTMKKRMGEHKYSMREGFDWVIHARSLFVKGELNLPTDYWAPTLMVLRKPGIPKSKR